MSKASGTATVDYALLAEFRHVQRQFLAFSEAAARRAGLTPQQHQALLAVRGSAAAMSVGDLSRSLLVRHHSAAGLATRLARAGLLKRKRDPADRRRVVVSLTGKADRVLARLSVAHRDELKRLAPMLRAILAKL